MLGVAIKISYGSPNTHVSGLNVVVNSKRFNSLYALGRNNTQILFFSTKIQMILIPTDDVRLLLQLVYVFWEIGTLLVSPKWLLLARSATNLGGPVVVGVLPNEGEVVGKKDGRGVVGGAVVTAESGDRSIDSNGRFLRLSKFSVGSFSMMKTSTLHKGMIRKLICKAYNIDALIAT